MNVKHSKNSTTLKHFFHYLRLMERTGTRDRGFNPALTSWFDFSHLRLLTGRWGP